MRESGRANRVANWKRGVVEASRRPFGATALASSERHTPRQKNAVLLVCAGLHRPSQPSFSNRPSDPTVSTTATAKVIIANRLGLHARPAMMFVEAAMKFKAEITVRRTDQDETIDGKSIM